MARSLLTFMAVLLLGSGSAWARPPAWLRDLATASVPPQAEDVEAVRLLDEVELVVAPDGQMRKRVRGAVRILRRGGARYALLQVPQDTWRKVRSMHGWTLPASGKAAEVATRDALEISIVNGEGSELITDLRMMQLQIPDAAPGATVGYEYEVSLNPLEMADTFGFQDLIPVQQASYTLKLPPGWSVQPTWLNHGEVAATTGASQQWQWTLRDIPPVAVEPGMPPWKGVAGHLFLALSPPGKAPQLGSWAGIGSWFLELSEDRRVASSDIRAKVAEITASATTDLERVRALARFVQRDVRYVSIQLGIGGFQPHPAAEVFLHRYGDCKDKATLLAVMLAEAGIQSMPVLVNTERSHVQVDTPPSLQFDHVILAIKLPRDMRDASLLATVGHDDGELLFFDPTDELTPLGRIRGELQDSVGLLVLAEESRLVTLPRASPDRTGIHRTARFVLDEQGTLAGSVVETITGQEAMAHRGALRAAPNQREGNRLVELRLAQSLAAFNLLSASSRNQDDIDLPLQWEYQIAAPAFARQAGDLLIIRPRVLGVEAVNLPGEDSKREHDLVLVEPRLARDEIVIEIPAGFAVDSMPDPVEIDAGFAAYRSHTRVDGRTITYSRSHEIRDLTVPAARIEEFRSLHREIARDERAVVVLKRTGT